MHKYLRAVGFSQFEKKSQVDKFFDDNLRDDKLISTYITQDMRLCGQYKIPVCLDAGISVIGEQEKGALTNIDFYYPYLNGYDYTLIQECTIERHSDKESYAGIIDDYRMGIALIFYLINGNVYNSMLKNNKINEIKIDRIFLSALSISGRIILPVDNKGAAKNEFQDEDKLKEVDDDIDEYELENGENEGGVVQVEEYDAGDEEEDDEERDSLPSRLIDEMGDFQDGLGTKMISIGIGIKLPKDPVGEQEGRLVNEDLYSIVETSLVPYGIECDKYQIVAEILSVNKKINSYTQETVIEMRVNTMGLVFNLMINEQDLEGEPLPGRRFRGVIWLQGYVEFLTKDEGKEKQQ